LFGPIFNREFLTVPRRSRHYVTRAAYLGTLWVISLTAWLATVGWERTATLGETARFGPLLFQLLTSVQLALFLFFSALASVSAIALEKDRRTFVLLLMTDLRNDEIVLGKLLGSLLPILLLLGATVPMLMFVVLLGGVAVQQVVQAILVMAATSLAAGALGGVIALWRDKTFQSLALTGLLLVLYLTVVRGLGLLLPESAIHWQLWLDPLLALQSAQQPTVALVRGFAPAYGYSLAMAGIAAVLIGIGLVRLRVWNPSGEPIMQRERVEDERGDLSHAKDKEETLLAVPAADSRTIAGQRANVHAAPGHARTVGENPILWREVRTRAYGRRPLLVKLAYFLVVALVCYPAVSAVLAGQHYPFMAAYGILPVVVLSLLLITAQAVTSITSERDIGALDLLLVTDLTPKEFVFGKLGGILWNVKEFLIPPLLLIAFYGWHYHLATPPAKHPEFALKMNVLSFLCIEGAFLVLVAFCMMLGMHVALRNQNSRVAILNALSTIFFLSVGTLICVALIVINGQFEYQWTSFLFFLGAGVGGMWWVLNGSRPSQALTLASWCCPLGVLWTVMNILVAKPGSQESADPVGPFLVITAAFGFTIAAMLVPLLSEFDVALGRTTGGAD
jgi:ABC-type transport system involved in multi-copper enzyme maturation permease subunit